MKILVYGAGVWTLLVLLLRKQLPVGDKKK